MLAYAAGAAKDLSERAKASFELGIAYGAVRHGSLLASDRTRIQMPS